MYPLLVDAITLLGQQPLNFTLRPSEIVLERAAVAPGDAAIFNARLCRQRSIRLISRQFLLIVARRSATLEIFIMDRAGD
jgi:hypothetical protein